MLQQPERLRSVLLRALPMSAPRTLAHFIDELREEEARDLPDVVVPIAELRMSMPDVMEIPGRGSARLNTWSQRQLAGLTGVRWGRWFAEAGDADVCNEMNARLRRGSGEVRLRRRVMGDHAELRAVVGPTFTPIKDSVIAESIAASMKVRPSDLRLVRAASTAMTTSFVVAVPGGPFRAGQGRVGELQGGISVRNSNTGAAALLAQMHLTRIICSNGMTAPVGDAELFRRKHRGLRDDVLHAALARKLDGLPDRLRDAGRRLEASEHRPVHDVRAEVRHVLEGAKLPRRFEDPVLDAFEEEPFASRFGVAMALTAAAKRMSPEDRHELEVLGGAYVARP